jgi:hypothetical protein
MDDQRGNDPALSSNTVRIWAFFQQRAALGENKSAVSDCRCEPGGEGFGLRDLAKKFAGYFRR